MPFGCIEKKPGKAYCGEDIKSNDYAFQSAERAYQFYDPSKVANPDPRRLWACKGCIAAIKAEVDKAAGEGIIGALIAGTDKSKV